MLRNRVRWPPSAVAAAAAESEAAAAAAQAAANTNSSNNNNSNAMMTRGTSSTPAVHDETNTSSYNNSNNINNNSNNNASVASLARAAAARAPSSLSSSSSSLPSSQQGQLGDRLSFSGITSVDQQQAAPVFTTASAAATAVLTTAGTGRQDHDDGGTRQPSLHDRKMIGSPVRPVIDNDQGQVQQRTTTAKPLSSLATTTTTATTRRLQPQPPPAPPPLQPWDPPPVRTDNRNAVVATSVGSSHNNNGTNRFRLQTQQHQQQSNTIQIDSNNSSKTATSTTFKDVGATRKPTISSTAVTSMPSSLQQPSNTTTSTTISQPSNVTLYQGVDGWMQSYWHRLTEAARQDGRLLDPIWDTAVVVTAAQDDDDCERTQQNGGGKGGGAESNQTSPTSSSSAHYTKWIVVTSSVTDDDVLYQQAKAVGFVVAAAPPSAAASDPAAVTTTNTTARPLPSLSSSSSSQQHQPPSSWIYVSPQFAQAATVNGHPDHDPVVTDGWSSLETCATALLAHTHDPTLLRLHAYRSAMIAMTTDGDHDDDDAQRRQHQQQQQQASDAINNNSSSGNSNNNDARTMVVPKWQCAVTELIRCRTAVYNQHFRRQLALNDIRTCCQWLQESIFAPPPQPDAATEHMTGRVERGGNNYDNDDDDDRGMDEGTDSALAGDEACPPMAGGATAAAFTTATGSGNHSIDVDTTASTTAAGNHHRYRGSTSSNYYVHTTSGEAAAAVAASSSVSSQHSGAGSATSNGGSSSSRPMLPGSGGGGFRATRRGPGTTATANIMSHAQRADHALHLLKTQWPHPALYILKTTGVVKLLKKAATTATLQRHRHAAWELLQYWQDVWELGRLANSTTPTAVPPSTTAATHTHPLPPHAPTMSRTNSFSSHASNSTAIMMSWQPPASSGAVLLGGGATTTATASTKLSIECDSQHHIQLPISYRQQPNAAAAVASSNDDDSTAPSSATSVTTAIINSKMSSAAAALAFTTRQRQAMERAVQALIRQQSAPSSLSQQREQQAGGASAGPISSEAATTATKRRYITKTTHRLRDLVICCPAPPRPSVSATTTSARSQVKKQDLFMDSAHRIPAESAVRMAQTLQDYGMVILEDYCSTEAVLQLRREHAHFLYNDNSMISPPGGGWTVRSRPGNRLDHQLDLDHLFAVPHNKKSSSTNHILLPSVSSAEPTHDAMLHLALRILHELPSQLFPNDELVTDQSTANLVMQRHQQEPGQIPSRKAGGWKLVAAGVQQALGRRHKEPEESYGTSVGLVHHQHISYAVGPIRHDATNTDTLSVPPPPPPPPQQWHSDGPSLFTAHHHPTHCFTVHIPLVLISAWNGTTEFVPGTHEDQRYQDVIADFLEAAAVAQDEEATGAAAATATGNFMDHDTDLMNVEAVKLSNTGNTNMTTTTSRRAYKHIKNASIVRAEVKAGTAVVFDTRILHRGLPNQSVEHRPVLYFTLARDWFDYPSDKPALQQQQQAAREAQEHRPASPQPADSHSYSLLNSPPSSPVPSTNVASNLINSSLGGHLAETTQDPQLQQASAVTNSAGRLCHRLYGSITGRYPPEYNVDDNNRDLIRNSGVLNYGHRHYTTRFDLLLMERMLSENPTTRAQAMTNVAAILMFGNYSLGDKELVCREFLYTLDCKETVTRKRSAIVAQHYQHRKARVERKQQQGSKLRKSSSRNDDDPHNESSANLTASSHHTHDWKHISNMQVLYELAIKLVFQESTILPKFGFTQDEYGLCVLMALLKAHVTAAGLEWTGLTVGRIEEAFSCFWNMAESRSRFQFYSTLVSNPADKPLQVSSSDRRLIVVFSGLGSIGGVVRPEFTSTLRSAGLLDQPHVDLLHVMDFGASWYCQDPSGNWKGGEYYYRELQSRIAGYQHVSLIGEGMGGAAALRFSPLADVVLAIAPHLDLGDGSTRKRSTPALVIRKDFTPTRRKDFQDQLVTAIYTSRARIVIHYARGESHDARRHVELIPPKDSVELVGHDCGGGDGSNEEFVLSTLLKKKGVLPIIMKDILTPTGAKTNYF